MTDTAAAPRGLLLDTCTIIWLGQGALASRAAEAIVHAALADGVFVSPVSAWEIGLFADPGRGAKALSFPPDPQRWFAKLMTMAAISPAPLTNDIAIAASSLPGAFHRDPADRLLTATARTMGIAIMTSDRKILDYASAGHVAAVGC